ncbi:MAG: hypothetical protein CM1200mP27_12600 [Chloroflexota bacterium]|nr:MAG: hypothetical protein CM1200mP27_12600 [Chloroflexota bacterium]
MSNRLFVYLFAVDDKSTQQYYPAHTVLNPQYTPPKEEIMVKKKGSALMGVYADVDIEHDAEFNAWYNEEHIPERMSAPGFLDSARYQAVKGARGTWPFTNWNPQKHCNLPNTSK